MADNVFSFSVKTEEEKNLVQLIKKECRRKGISFSFVVLEALKGIKQPVGAK